MVAFVWIALGLIAGLFASKRFHHTAGALALDIALGVGGAIAGGLVCYTLGIQQAAVVSAFFAAIGSVATLAGYRSIFRPA